ncbi:MAG: hypothetical protein ISS34_03025 [Candidatus Omnitrophica bacterium]|nr:hypothetical protein [Candidatus Omnitrophota bacterium]
MNIGKVIVFSILVSANMIVWYEVFGVEFLYGVVVIMAYLALGPYKGGIR